MPKNYSKFVKGIRQAMRERAAKLLAKLDSCKNQEQIERCCQEEKADFEAVFESLNTRAAYMTQYRNAIKEWQQHIFVGRHKPTEKFEAAVSLSIVTNS